MFQHLITSSNKKSHSPQPGRLPMLRKKAASFVEASAGESPFLRLADLVEKSTTQAAKADGSVPNLPRLNKNLSLSALSALGDDEDDTSLSPRRDSILLMSHDSFDPEASIISAPAIETITYSENAKVPPRRIGDGMWSSTSWSGDTSFAASKLRVPQRRRRRDSWDTSVREGPIESPRSQKRRVRRWLLKKGIPSIPSYDERIWASWSPTLLKVTPLHEACFEGDLSICKYLVENSICSLMNADNVLGDSPLHLACYKGHLRIVKWLHKAGANLKTLNGRGRSCFMLASREGHLLTMNWLLENSALNYYEETDEKYIAREPVNPAVPAVPSLSNVAAPFDPHQPLWQPGNEGDDELFASKGGDMASRWRTGAGHLSRACLESAIPVQADNRQRKFLQKHCVDQLALHRVFFDLILPSSTSLSYFKYFSTLVPVAKEVNLMVKLVEYLGVPKGRELRNIREAFLLL